MNLDDQKVWSEWSLVTKWFRVYVPCSTRSATGGNHIVKIVGEEDGRIFFSLMIPRKAVEESYPR